MDSLPVETLLLIFKQFNVRDLLNLSCTCRYYLEVASDEKLWRNLYELDFIIKDKSKKTNSNNNISLDELLLSLDHPSPIISTNKFSKQQQRNNEIHDIIPTNGWKNEYKKKSIKFKSKEGVNIKWLLDMHVKMNIYIKNLENLMIRAVESERPELLKCLLKYSRDYSANPLVGNKCLTKNYLRLVYDSCLNNDISINNTVSSAGSNVFTTGLLLVGKSPKLSTTDVIHSEISYHPRAYKLNLQTISLLIDKIVSQLTLFLCAQTGNVSCLQELIQVDHGSILLSKVTGIWDYGDEINGLSMLARKTIKPSYHITTMYSYANSNNSNSNSNNNNVDVESILKVLDVDLSRHAMIGKSLKPFAQQWDPEWSSFTPLHWAAYGGYVSSLKVLLKFGARLSALTSRGRTALDIARDNLHTPAVTYLEKQLAKQIKLSDFDQLKEMVKQGDSIGVNHFMNSYLFEKDVTVIGNQSIVMDLLRFTIVQNQPNIFVMLYNTLLPNNNSTPIESLTVDQDENTLLHVACTLGRVECCKLILERCANVDVFNRVLQSPLMLAIVHKQYPLVPLLLNSYASPILRGWKGMSALMLAADSDPETFEQLLNDQRLNLSDRNYDGQTIVHMIVQRKKTPLENMLLLADLIEASDDPKALYQMPDKYNNQPLHLATKSGNLPILNYLLSSPFVDGKTKSDVYKQIKSRADSNQDVVQCFEQYYHRSNITIPTVATTENVNETRYKNNDIFTRLSSCTIQTDQVADICRNNPTTTNQFSFISTSKLLNTHLVLGKYDVVASLMTYLTHYQIGGILTFLISENEKKLSEIKWFIDRVENEIRTRENANFYSTSMYSIIEKDNRLLLESFESNMSQFPICLETAFKHSSYRCARLLLERYSGPAGSVEEQQATIKQLERCTLKHFDQFKEMAKQFAIPSNAMQFSNNSLYSGYGYGYVTTPTETEMAIAKVADFKEIADNGKQIECQDCHIKVYETNLQDHQIVCLYRLATCPNAQHGCQAGPLPREKLSDHLSRECTYMVCTECDKSLTRAEFFRHIHEKHDTETWTHCVFCNQMLSGFKMSLSDRIIHINNNYNNTLPVFSTSSSEYYHIRNECKSINLQTMKATKQMVQIYHRISLPYFDSSLRNAVLYMASNNNSCQTNTTSSTGFQHLLLSLQILQYWNQRLFKLEIKLNCNEFNFFTFDLDCNYCYHYDDNQNNVFLAIDIESGDEKVLESIFTTDSGVNGFTHTTSIELRLTFQN
ncbi:ankyrin repeat-containing protein [Heterostelium album PN500]|uniref:Ankyrin repeat-containing protein n=1 Tax=Heterostelium pallidum (strain ATCC 26659 / Pp 5 / PN500) TaxID=670386 RepID=D3BPX7_HETP5|nr:ankyrin repeat-containing protein [Heterostelium album PN500]EFA76260.1 ankyrin repeat-containing protein [Heterostelium album PN500]|eukprot:XP_020428393.1 ankyrin repeat-containing protein [Heterostelium album PN500]